MDATVLGFGAQGWVFRVLGRRVEGFGVTGLGFRVEGVRLRVQAFGFRA